MPREWCNYANRRSRLSFWLVLAAAGFQVISQMSVVSAQELRQPPAQAKPLERSMLKPSLPNSDFKISERTTGVTSVSVEPGLESVLRGNEPKNKLELIALQNQQAKIAEKINAVTVNLQHGSTQGSGVIITGDGYILTAAHVAGRPKQRINIILQDGTRIEGETMGVNRNMDAGLVVITKPMRDSKLDPWPHATIGISSDLKKGQWCLATGHPGGWTPDRPAVVRVGRLLKFLPSTLITDCALIGGDSGGPLFNLNGELIGIHSRIGVDVDDNMHVPVDVFAESWDRLVKNEAWGTLPGFKPAIGVRGATDPASSDMCKIALVDAGGPADKAGIRAGDIILKFDSLTVQNFDNLKEAVDSVTPGEQVVVELQRDGLKKSLRLVVGVRE
ncbi:MAG: S1C family serine protease [Planctomycetota bacterium]|nr:S1C family serine protease [Planctomycetota bacterium]